MLPDKITSSVRHAIDASDAAAATVAFHVSRTHSSHACNRCCDPFDATAATAVRDDSKIYSSHSHRAKRGAFFVVSVSLRPRIFLKVRTPRSLTRMRERKHKFRLWTLTLMTCQLLCACFSTSTRTFEFEFILLLTFTISLSRHYIRISFADTWYTRFSVPEGVLEQTNQERQQFFRSRKKNLNCG